MQIGDKVEWTHVGQSGRTMSMTLREGTIESINGPIATVRMKRGGRAHVAIVRLRAKGAPSQIGEFVQAMREAHKP